MHTISFIFVPGTYDEDFHHLDDQIQAIAEATEGYLGVETWLSPDGTRSNAVYYWSDLNRLKSFSGATAHLQAKAQNARWYEGYQVVVAEITAAYGDGRLDHFTSALTRRGPSEPGQV